MEMIKICIYYFNLASRRYIVQILKDQQKLKINMHVKFKNKTVTSKTIKFTIASNRNKHFYIFVLQKILCVYECLIFQ